ncbi:MAG: hypothetical protein ACC700_17500 [Anaerolineales bacterium]
MSSRADRLSELSQELDRIAEAFAKADQQSLDGLAQLERDFRDWLIEAGLLSPDGTIPQDSLLSFLGPGFLVAPTPTMDMDGESEKPPWWGPLAQAAARVGGLFDSNVGEPLRDMPETWRGILYNARIIALSAAAQGWFAYDQSLNQFFRERWGMWKDNLAMLDVIWNEKVWAVQEAGLPADGPITSAMAALAETDSNGIPISIVGAELVQLIENRGGVNVHFSDLLTRGRNGVAPIRGLIVVPNRYMDASYQSVRENSLLVGHELAHVLQRDLPEFPDGYAPAGSWIYDSDGRLSPLSFETGSPVVGDFTLYMEVQSNIVTDTIQYDQLAAERSSYPTGSPQYVALSSEMQLIADDLATYTGNPADAAAYILQDYRWSAPSFYEGEMVREVIFGPRIPPGGWEHWLAEQGFSEAAIKHIADIAGSGVPNKVWLEGMLDYDWQPNQSTATPTPTPTGTPTPTPTTTPTPTPSPTQTPTSSPSPSAEP